jgi:NADPH:quinone reductase-like Zn-dependent oxidoreductase
MRQIWISKSGPPEVLVVKEAPDPHPAAGELRIRVEASGVNFADIMGRLGLYPDLPRIPVVPGYEVAGRVDAVGAKSTPAGLGATFSHQLASVVTLMWFAFRKLKSSRDRPTCPLKRARRFR